MPGNQREGGHLEVLEGFELKTGFKVESFKLKEFFFLAGFKLKTDSK